MITFATVQASLHNSNWPAETKQAGINLAAHLGRESLSYLQSTVNETGSYVNAEITIGILNRVGDWYQQIERGNQQQLLDEIEAIVKKDDEREMKPLLAIILDIRANRPLEAKLDPDLSQLFDLVELKYFDKLPQKEVVEMLSERLHQVVPLADIHQEVKRYCYYHDLLEPTDPRIMAYRKALENSPTIVGSMKINQWLDNFVQSRVGSTDRTTYNVAHYVTSSPEVAKLSGEDKQIITEILQLYNWLFNPFTTAEEIDGYESHRFIGIGNHEAVIDEPRSEKSAPPLEKETPEETPEQTAAQQKKIMQDIAAHAPKSMRYNNEGANIRDMINHKTPIPRGGLVLERKTNIKLQDETDRLAHDRKQKQDSDIQNKLEELRQRNPNA